MKRPASNRITPALIELLAVIAVEALLAAMADHRRAKRLEGFLADFHWSWYVQFARVQ